MATFDNLFLAVLTRNQDDAGTSSTFNLTVNVGDDDVLDKDYEPDLDQGEATLFGDQLQPPFDSNGLTNSSIRLGLRGDDAWSPQDVLLFGLDFESNRMAALAMESDLTDWLSTDWTEGKLTMPIRLVDSGGSAALIRRVLLLVDTAVAGSYSGPIFLTNSGTDSPIELEIRAGGNLVLKQEIDDTPQPDLEAGTTNWYLLDAAVPFTRAQVLANGGITLRILGDDAWRPLRLFLFGLDTATGRPDKVVSLVSLPVWPHGWMSTDTSEGVPSVELEVVSA
jgi:hypothetical protein